MNWQQPPWVLAVMPAQWSQWAIDYQLAKQKAAEIRSELQAARNGK